MLNFCLQLLRFQRPDPPARCDDVVTKRAEFQCFARPCILSTDILAVRPLWRYFTQHAGNAGASTDTEAGCCQAPWCHQCCVTKTRSRQLPTAAVIYCSSDFSYSGTASICNFSLLSLTRCCDEMGLSLVSVWLIILFLYIWAKMSVRAVVYFVYAVVHDHNN